MDINDEDTNRVVANNESRDNSTVSGVPHESGNETAQEEKAYNLKNIRESSNVNHIGS